jgi:hypothetical protein
MSGYAKVYISMPPQFLADLDRTAQEEHLSRSALIREAIKLYMAHRRRREQLRFFEMSRSLREKLADRPDEEIEQRIDRAVSRVRGGNGE